MKKLFKFALLACFLLGANHLKAQKDEEFAVDSNYQTFGISYFFGGQIYNGNFVYNPGYKLEAGYYKALNKRVLVGVNAGYAAFSENENFIPIAVDIIGFAKKDKQSPYYSMHLGYSFAWDNDYNSYKHYNMSGGVNLGVDFGKRFVIKDKMLLFNFSYQHQFAHLEYDYVPHYSELLNYDWISLGLKFWF